jgi:hypothetical protein
MIEHNKLLKGSIVNALHQNNVLDASGIDAYKIQGILFLKGTVCRESEKALAEKVAFSLSGVGKVVNQLSIRQDTTGKFSENFPGNTDTKMTALMKITAIPQIEVMEPEVSVSNGTISLYGIVDAFWKRACIGNIMKDEFPNLYVENSLTVIPPREGDYLPENNPVREPEMFHLTRDMSHKKQTL